MGPGGVAIIVEALSNNRNRTGGAVRAVFSKQGGNLGATGAVAHMFAHVGEIAYPASAATADAMLEAAIEAGADDVQSDADGHLVTCAFESLGAVSAALEAKLGEPASVKALWRPMQTTAVDEEKAASILKLIAGLEDDDDVQNVYSNFEVSDAVLAETDRGVRPYRRMPVAAARVKSPIWGRCTMVTHTSQRERCRTVQP